MRMRTTTLTWRPINRINFTLTNDRLFTRFQSFWFLEEDVLLTSNNHIIEGALLASSQNLVFCSYTVKHIVLFIYIIYGALAAQGGICNCADCRIYNTYDQFGRLTLV